MKKFFIVLLSLLIIIIFFIYLLIPSPLFISRIQPVKLSEPAISRYFLNYKKYQLGWKSISDKTEKPSYKDSIYSFEGYNFIITPVIHPEVNIEIQKGINELPSSILIIPITKDSCILQWSLTMPGSMNPIVRIKNYLEAEKLSRTLSEILSQLKIRFENKKEMYGMDISETKLGHEFFLSTKMVTLKEPSEAEIYSQIQKLRSYATKNSSLVVDSPMLHIDIIKGKKSQYQTIVGLPVNKLLKDEGEISMKRMPMGGKIIQSLVTGGNSTINQGFKVVELYLSDLQMGSPAIPFQVLKTNRILETDSNTWITKLIYPVL